jgi:hypothetical protein
MGYDDRRGPSRGGGGGGGRHNPYGRDDRGRDDYEEEVIEISTNRLYVHNLSWRVSWQDLKDHFRQAGEVIHAKIMTEGPGGRSKGCGIVEMGTVDEAANAIEMLNDTDLNGRNILIREDREDNGGRGGGGGGGGFRSDRGFAGRGGGPGDGDRCNKCGGIGHWARDCPSRIDVGRGSGGGRFRSDHDDRGRDHRGERRERPPRREPGADDTCNRCGKTGHWARDCPEPRNDGKTGARGPGADDKCNICGELGHWARDCPNKDKFPKRGGGGGGGDGGDEGADDAAALDNDLEEYKAAAPAGDADGDVAME